MPTIDRAEAKLAELRARGKVAEPTAAELTPAHRNTTAAAMHMARVAAAQAKAVGVVVPAYLSLEELSVESGVKALHEVTVPLLPMPLPTLAARYTRLPPEADANGAGAAYNLGGGGVARDSVVNPAGAGSAAAGAAVAIAAIEAAAAAMTRLGCTPCNEPKPPAAAPAAGVPTPRARPPAPPPGFSAATAPGHNGAAAHDRAASLPATPALKGGGPAASAATSGAGASAGAGTGAGASASAGTKPQATPQQQRQTVPYSPLAWAGGAATTSTPSDGSSAPGTTGAADVQQLSPLPPRTPPPQVPAAAPWASVPSSGASLSANGNTTEAHVQSARAATTPTWTQPPRASVPTALGFSDLRCLQLAEGNDGQYGQQHGPYGYGNGYGCTAPYIPYLPVEQMYCQTWQSNQRPPPRQQEEQARPPQQQQQQQEPVAAQQPARPPRPPLRPQSLEVNPLLFKLGNGTATKAALCRTLESAFHREPELFQAIYGFDLVWWMQERRKQLGEDDLFAMVTWRDYTAVVVRVSKGSLAGRSSGVGRQKRWLTLNPVLTALLGYEVYGNALVLRLRVEFADQDPGTRLNVAGEGLASETSSVSNAGDVNHLCCIPLSAKGVRDMLCEAETLAWHLDQYRAFLENITAGMKGDGQVGWLARLPRTPLDAHGDPDLRGALQLAMEAVGLPQAVARAAMTAALGGGDDEGPGGGGACSGGGTGGAGQEGGEEGGDEDRAHPGKGSGGGGASARRAAGAAGGSADTAVVIPAALAPLLRCLRCSSPWCSPAPRTGAPPGWDGGGRSRCPFGHVWRPSLDQGNADCLAAPVFNAARPIALTGARLCEQLQPRPCVTLVKKLSQPDLWRTGLSEMVATVLKEDEKELTTVAAAVAAAEAIAGRRVLHQEAPDEANSGAADEGSSTADGEDGGTRSTDGAATEGGRVSRDAAVHAPRQLWAEEWPFYMSFCSDGPSCTMCHSCHEVQLAAAVHRLRGAGRSQSSGTAVAGSGALVGGARAGFELLAQYEGDLNEIDAKMESHGSGKPKRAGSKGTSGSNGVAAAAGGASAAAAVGVAGRGSFSGALGTAAATATAAAAPLGGARTGKLNWADEVDEADQAAAAGPSVAGPAQHMPCRASNAGPSLQSVTRGPHHHHQQQDQHQSTVGSERAFRAPIFCTAAVPAVGRRDSRPLPKLPDHLDDEAAGFAFHDGEGALATSPALHLPDRATVVTSMAAKSRNGVYVPPHLRLPGGEAEQAEQAEEVEGRSDGEQQTPAEGGAAVVTPTPPHTSASPQLPPMPLPASPSPTQRHEEQVCPVPFPLPVMRPPQPHLQLQQLPLGMPRAQQLPAQPQAVPIPMPVPEPVPVPVPEPVPVPRSVPMPMRFAGVPLQQQYAAPYTESAGGAAAAGGSVAAHMGGAAAAGGSVAAHMGGDGDTDNDIGEFLSLCVPAAQPTSGGGALQGMYGSTASRSVAAPPPSAGWQPLHAPALAALPGQHHGAFQHFSGASLPPGPLARPNLVQPVFWQQYMPATQQQGQPPQQQQMLFQFGPAGTVTGGRAMPPALYGVTAAGGIPQPMPLQQPLQPYHPYDGMAPPPNSYGPYFGGG